MDEMSDIELRRAATEGCLRRAFGAPVRDDGPSPFAALLTRLAEREGPARGFAGQGNLGGLRAAQRA